MRSGPSVGGDAPSAPVGASLVRNSIANAVYFGVQMAVALLSLPLLLRLVGSRDYGIYAVSLGVVQLLQFLNLGLGVAVLRYVPEYRREGSWDRLQALVSQAYVLAFGANAIVAVVVAAIALWGGDLLRVAPDARSTFTSVGLALALGTLVTGVSSVPRYMLAAVERADLRTMLDLPLLLGPLLAVGVARLLDLGVVGYVAVVQTTMALSGGLLVLGCRRVVPEVRHGPRRYGEGTPGFFGFNVLQTLNHVADTLFYTSDRLVLQRLRGSVSVTQYAVAERPNRFAEAVISFPLSAIVPVASKMFVEERRDRLEALLSLGTRAYLAIVTPPLLVLIAVMETFLELWVGERFTSVTLPAQLFVATLLVAAPFKVFSHVLVAKGRVKEVVLTKLVYAPLNLTASALLAGPHGVLGVVLPTAFFWFVVQPVVWTLLMRSENMTRDVWDVRMGAMAAAGAAIFYAASTVSPGTLVALVAFVVAVSGLGALLLLGVGLRSDERRIVLNVVKSFRPRGRT